MILKIYGVFEDDKCLIVGSTIQSLNERARQYKKYRWFDPGRHQHRILWQGSVSCPFLRAVKEAVWIGRMGTWFPAGRNQQNPVSWLLGVACSNYEFYKAGARALSRESRSRGGTSACNIIHKLYPTIKFNNGKRLGEYNRQRAKNHPEQHGEIARRGGLVGGSKGGHVYWQSYGVPAGTHMDRVNGGRIGGRATKETTNGRKSNGGRKYIELYGSPGNTESRKKGGLANGNIGHKIGPIARHQRWHVNRGVKKSKCELCAAAI